MISTTVTASILFALWTLITCLLLRNRRGDRVPPGPRGWPLVGNINDLPPPGKTEYLHWLKHKDIYGPISSVTVLGQPMIIIHDKNLALELLEKRSTVYSGKPKMIFAFNMIGWIDALPGLQNNSKHRLYRRYAHKQLGTKAALSRYYPIQEAGISRLMWRLKQNQGKTVFHDLKTQTGGYILKVLYDYDIETHKPDPYVALAGRAIDQFSEAAMPGKWLVDLVPILEHVPAWLPGAGFKKTAQLWRKTLLSCVDMPYNFVKEQRHRGVAARSLVSRSIDEAETENGVSNLSEEQERAIKWCAVSLYIGAEDTSATTMNAFFLAMSMFPEVQRKAQEEIDRVVGTGRLPNFGDRHLLPYLDAIIDEALRWHPITPLGVPHAADQEDHINGYRIPKGSLLVTNVWWFTRDPEVYHDPEVFKPERYLEPYNEPSPRNVVFGFGRRICPGRLLADATLYLTFAQALAAFNIKPTTDEHGVEIPNVHVIEPGLVAKVGPFEVSIKPRSEAHAVMIEQLADKYPREESGEKYRLNGTDG